MRSDQEQLRVNACALTFLASGFEQSVKIQIPDSLLFILTF